MVLIGKITDEAIVDNIKKRFNDDLIYVRIPFLFLFCAPLKG